MIEYKYTKEGRISFVEKHSEDSSTNGFVRLEDEQSIIDSGVEIAPYVEPVKTLDQLQDEAVLIMASTVIAECKSGTGKLYFSNIESAAMYTSSIQKDAEIRARAVQLVEWSFSIDAYALSVVFSIEQGGEVPTIESFIAGLPKL